MNRILLIIAFVTAAAAFFRPTTSSPNAEDFADLRSKVAALEKTIAKLDQPIGQKFIFSQTAQIKTTSREEPATHTLDPAEIQRLRDQVTQLAENQQRLDKALTAAKKARDTAFTNVAEAASVALDAQASFEHRIQALRALRAADQVPADVAAAMLTLAPKLLDPKSREDIYRQFEDFDDPLVVSTLLTALRQDEDAKVRKKVGEILSSVQNIPDVRTALALAITTDPDLEVREKVRTAMQGIRPAKE
jgi:chaperonin cofactor prefoldin